MSSSVFGVIFVGLAIALGYVAFWLSYDWAYLFIRSDEPPLTDKVLNGLALIAVLLGYFTVTAAASLEASKSRLRLLPSWSLVASGSVFAIYAFAATCLSLIFLNVGDLQRDPTQIDFGVAVWRVLPSVSLCTLSMHPLLLIRKRSSWRSRVRSLGISSAIVIVIISSTLLLGIVLDEPTVPRT